MPDDLRRIAEALERLAPPPVPAPSFTEATAYVWHPDPDRLEPVDVVDRVDLVQLIGIDRAKQILLETLEELVTVGAWKEATHWLEQ